jgi:predicted ArsR family transcriptional regulator
MDQPADQQPADQQLEDQQPKGQRRRLLDDPRAIRALAHPIRLDLQALIGLSGRITAADAARELGISHALASHHLRQLAKYGFVEQVTGADNRERPWRLVHTSVSFDGVEDRPGGSDAVAVLERVLAERTLESLLTWHERKDSMPADWRRNTGIGRSTVYLTADELAALVGAFEKALGEYVEQRPLDDLDARPEGSLPVSFTMIVIPEKGI